MSFFKREQPARAQQSDDEKRRLGYTEDHFRAFRTSAGSRDLSVTITRIVSTMSACATPRAWDALETRYEVEGLARVGKYRLPCEVIGWDEPPREDVVPANIVEGWASLRPYVTALASLNGRYFNPDEHNPAYEEIRPALNVFVPLAFFRQLAATHLRTQATSAGFRLNAFHAGDVARRGAREEWEWSRFVEWMQDEANSAGSWQILAHSVVTWEVREFPPTN